MVDISVNWFAVVVAGIVYFVLGAVWYSPLLFAKPWMKYSGIDPKKPGTSPVPGMVTSFVTGLVMAFVLAVLLRSVRADAVGVGITWALLAAIGLVGAVMVTNYTFEGKNAKLLLINAGYPAVGYCLMAIVLTLWK
jgi:hypothetical protein